MNPKIPKGWHELKTGTRICAGDKVLCIKNKLGLIGEADAGDVVDSEQIVIRRNRREIYKDKIAGKFWNGFGWQDYVGEIQGGYRQLNYLEKIKVGDYFFNRVKKLWERVKKVDTHSVVICEQFMRRKYIPKARKSVVKASDGL